MRLAGSRRSTAKFDGLRLPPPCSKFAEGVFDIYQEGDVVWAQDYHLMLLPAMLKKQHPKMKVRRLHARSLCGRL